ncbi:TPA: hypothetical protein EYN98_11685 [Candidatus Poribacteria bacterium]|nr:hypothetical protein [Candidatus Poribacteria bacterium]
MPIYTMDDVRLLHIHVPKTGGTSITEKFFDEGWTVTYHTRFEHTGASNYPEPAQHFHYEILTECKVFDLPFEFVFMTCRHPFNKFISEYLFQNKSIEVNLHECVEVTLEQYFQHISTRVSTSYANNHVRKQVDFYGEKVDYIKKQESDDWRFIVKYIDVFHIPQIYKQSYDLSEYEYIRKEVEELYKEDMIFFGY